MKQAVTITNEKGEYITIKELAELYREDKLIDVDDNDVYCLCHESNRTKITQWLPHNELKLVMKLSDDIAKQQSEILWNR